MDYVSNVISLYPDNLFNKKGNIKFEKKYDVIRGYANDVKFNFLDLEFDDVHSVFYFEKNINFIGGMWANIFKE